MDNRNNSVKICRRLSLSSLLYREHAPSSSNPSRRDRCPISLQGGHGSEIVAEGIPRESLMVLPEENARPDVHSENLRTLTSSLKWRGTASGLPVEEANEPRYPVSGFWCPFTIAEGGRARCASVVVQHVYVPLPRATPRA